MGDGDPGGAVIELRPGAHAADHVAVRQPHTESGGSRTETLAIAANRYSGIRTVTGRTVPHGRINVDVIASGPGMPPKG